MQIGLRVDTDTYSGTRVGVPQLLDSFARYGITASFFFSVGPDNMGRHVRRLFRKEFLFKMLRTRATRLYGWDVLLRGTLWPGPVIAKVLVPLARRAAQEGHEVGLHAWDHHRWQEHVSELSPEDVAKEMNRGFNKLAEMMGKPPESFASPGWKCTNNVLQEEQTHGLRYGTDCRGTHIFLPVVDGRRLEVPQIPVTLPTYDEVIGRNGITDRNYNAHLLSQVRADRLNVLTVHAEVEGMRCRALFEEFIKDAFEKGMTFSRLCDLLPEDTSVFPFGTVDQGHVPGREGWVAVQN